LLLLVVLPWGFALASGADLPPGWSGLRRLGNVVNLMKSDPRPADQWSNNAVRGIAASADEVFASVRPDNQIAVLDAKTLAEKRRFPFTRPGPLVYDAKGRLWVIREGFTRHETDPMFYEPGRLLALDPQTGKQLLEITGLGMPVALAVDDKSPGKARLLVADGGLDQQVKLFDVGGEQPKAIGSVGAKGGTFAGVPGRVADAKFNGFTGIGTDGAGSFYAATTGWAYRYPASHAMPHQTELKCLPASAVNAPDAKALWSVHCVAHNIEGAGWDAKTGDIYVGSDARYEVDWSRPLGKEARYAAFLMNTRDDPDGIIWRWNRTPPDVRWLDGQRFLFVQDASSLLEVFRFDEKQMGEIGIPCVAYQANVRTLREWARAQADFRKDPQNGDAYFWAFVSRWLPDLPVPAQDNQKGWQWARLKWVDGANGAPHDGRAQAAEYTDNTALMPITGEAGHKYFIDARGGIWHVETWDAQPIVHEPFAGLKDGIPTWGAARTYPVPEPFTMVHCAFYDPGTDVMVLLGGTRDFAGSPWSGPTEAVRYGKWSTGRPVPGDRIMFLPPQQWYRPGGEGDWRRPGMEFNTVSAYVADDYLFVTNRTGQVRVIDMKLGNMIEWLMPGPEVLGVGGYFENRLTGVRAYRFSPDEYVILRQSNETVRIIAHRWRPADSGKLPVRGCIQPWALSRDGAVELQWGGRTSVTGPLKGYQVCRADTKEGPYQKVGGLVARSSFIDENRPNGQVAWYRVAPVGAQGEGPQGEPVSCAPARPVARQLKGVGKLDGEGYHRTTLGDWQGVYGKGAAIIACDRTGNDDADSVNTKLPPYAFLRFPGRRGKAEQSDDRSYPQSVLAPGKRCTGIAWFDCQWGPVRFRLDCTDGKPHRVSFYLAALHPDGPLKPRVEITDGTTGAVIVNEALPASTKAQGINAYASWEMAGRVDITIYDCAVQGIFFDTP